MLVSLHRRFVYVHIYKTAGSSLTAMLAPYVSPEMRSDTPRLDGLGWQGTWHRHNGQHSPLEPQLTELIQRGLVDTSFRVLSVVRNPYLWHHALWSRFYVERYPSLSFEDCLHHQLGLEERVREAFWAPLTQASFLRTEHPLEQVVGRFESLNESIPRMLAAVGIEAGDIPHVNMKVNPIPAATAFTDTAVRLVNELAAEDFDLFGYSKVYSAEELLAQSHRTSSDPRS